MLLHRYGNIEYILSLDVETGLSLVNTAIRKERDERIFRQWVVQLPFMTEKSFIGFSEYRDKLTGANVDRRSREEILAELDEVEKLFNEE